MSIYNILDTLCHEYGFIYALMSPSPNTNGPFSVNIPNNNEQPGPPFNHITNGSLTGSYSLGTNT